MGIRRLTRANFCEVGEWAGAHECWGLAAPIPEIRIGTPERFIRARLGDFVIKVGNRIRVVAF